MTVFQLKYIYYAEIYYNNNNNDCFSFENIQKNNKGQSKTMLAQSGLCPALPCFTLPTR